MKQQAKEIEKMTVEEILLESLRLARLFDNHHMIGTCSMALAIYSRKVEKFDALVAKHGKEKVESAIGTLQEYTSMSFEELDFYMEFIKAPDM